MSTWAYGALTRKREEAPFGTSTNSSPPGLNRWADVLAAMMPVEVLAAQAILVALTTQRSELANGDIVTTITSPGALRILFPVLVVISLLLYVVAHIATKGWSQWHRADWARMLIPPLAFIGWMMLLRSTAFDALVPEATDGARYMIVTVGGLALVAGAATLSYAADAPGSLFEKLSRAAARAGKLFSGAAAR